MIRKITCFSIQKNLPQYLGEQWIPKKSGLWWLSIEYIWKRALKKFWSVFFFFNWVLFSIWFNLKLESTGNYESTFLFFFFKTSRRMCVDSVEREWPFISLSRKSCPFARTHGPFSREHYPLLGTYFPLLFLSSLGGKKTAMAQWKQVLFWFFLYALKSLNTGLGNCLNIRTIDVKDSLKFTLHKFYNPPSTTLHSCFFCSFLIVLHCLSLFCGSITLHNRSYIIEIMRLSVFACNFFFWAD